MIIIKDEIRNLKNEKNKFLKTEIADLIIEEIDRLLDEMNNIENQVQNEVTGDITYEGTLNEMEILSSELIQNYEENLKDILEDLESLDSTNFSYFDGTIKKLYDILFTSKL